MLRHRILSFFILIVLSAPSLIWAHTCKNVLAGPPIFVSQIALKDLTVGQKEIGLHIVEDYKIPEMQGVEHFKVPVLAVRISSGTYYILQDRHHTLLGLAAHQGPDFILDLNLVGQIDQPLRADHEVVRDLAEQGQIYLGDEEVREGWTFKKNWPQDLFHLEDNPLRSLVKLSFVDLGLSGKTFIPFSQFYLAEALLAQGLLNPQDVDFDRAHVKRVNQAIFAQKSLYKLLVSMVSVEGKAKKKLLYKLKKIRQRYKAKSK